MKLMQRLNPNPSQPPLVRGGAGFALPLMKQLAIRLSPHAGKSLVMTRGSWRGFNLP